MTAAAFQPREELPKGVVRNHGALYWIENVAPGKQKWHRLGRTWTEAAPEYRRLVIQTRLPGYAKRALYDTAGGGGPIPVRFLKEMLANARKNARARQLECSVDLADLQSFAERSGGRCELTGIAFQYGQAKELRGAPVRRKRVWAPSLDRVDSSLGYTRENLRVVCFAVNAARQEFGDEVLMRVAEGLVRRQISSSDSAATRTKRSQKPAAEFSTAPRET